MKIKPTVAGLVLLVTAMLVSVCVAQENKLDAKALGEITFVSPESLAAKKYLGLTDKQKFSLGQIKAEIIFLEIFSMYCPVCQKDAPTVNKLFALIEAEPNLKNSVRFIGVGTGNTPYEVEVFRKKFNINFPLFPDDEFRIQKAFSQDIRTPTFVLARFKAGNQLEILKVRIGEIKDAQEFFHSISQLLSSK